MGVIWLMKDKLGGKRMKNSITLRPKVYFFVTDGGCVDI